MRSALRVISVLLLAGGCGGSAGPTSPASPPASSSTGSSSIGALAGNYDVTIEIPERCAEAAAIPRTLKYGATLTASQYQYLAMSIGPVFRGDVWPRGTGTAHLSLNNFDFNGCDGDPETLPDGRLLHICGSGPLRIEGTTMSGTVEGITWIGTPVVLSTSCGGQHIYRFTRR
jgi:hypothetical protein